MTHSHRVVACLDEMTRKVIFDRQNEGDIQLSDFVHDKTRSSFARDALHFCCDVSGIPKEGLRSVTQGNRRTAQRKTPAENGLECPHPGKNTFLEKLVPQGARCGG